MNVSIEHLSAREILDSRGNPTVEVRVRLANGTEARAQVPSGASTGRHEALELRDGVTARYAGKGVLRAVANVKDVLAHELAGWSADDQLALDQRMIEIDGTPDKSRLGANAILGVSCAVARAAASALGLPLWKYLAGGRKPVFPLPMVNILSGGHHAGHNIEFQDFLMMPHGFASYAAALEATVAVHRTARKAIEARGYVLTGTADEGGWGPRLATNAEALDVMMEAISMAGFAPGRQISIAIDVAATHFFREGSYHLRSEGRSLTAESMVDTLAAWCEAYPVVSIEDGLAEDDWGGWQTLTRRLGARVQLLGDDFFTTNPARLRRGIAEGTANAVLVKMNQIGTLTETFQVIDLAREAGYLAVISARSGETEDHFLADLAVASGAGQIKVGSVNHAERLTKYSRLAELEERGELAWTGPDPLRPFLT